MKPGSTLGVRPVRDPAVVSTPCTFWTLVSGGLSSPVLAPLTSVHQACVDAEMVRMATIKTGQLSERAWG